MTLGDLVALEPALDRLGAATDLPAKTRYALARLIEAVRKETKHFVTERTALFKALGTEQPNGDWQVPPEKMKDFRTKLEDLAAVEVTIDKWRLTYDVLDSLTLSANDEVSLLPLIIPREEVPDARPTP